MLSTLLILAALGQTSGCASPCLCVKPAECASASCRCGAVAACPSCATKKASLAGCPASCRCPFPGACKHPGCACSPVVGWRPRDEWRPFTANPVWEVFGHEEAGVFRYTVCRRRRAVPQLPAVGVGANAK